MTIKAGLYLKGVETVRTRDEGSKALARTQVYLSKTKLRLQVGI